jgi:8-oxo-dGTP diphosphatase
MDTPRPKVGVGVFILKDGKLLLGKRLSKDNHGDGEYCGPGGHVEFGETLEECAIRETREEVGIEIENVRFLCISSILAWKDKHYIDIGMVADWKSGEPLVTEPEVRADWAWYDLDNLPHPLFANEPIYIEAYRIGKMYFGTIR